MSGESDSESDDLQLKRCKADVRRVLEERRELCERCWVEVICGREVSHPRLGPGINDNRFPDDFMEDDETKEALVDGIIERIIMDLNERFLAQDEQHRLLDIDRWCDFMVLDTLRTREAVWKPMEWVKIERGVNYSDMILDRYEQRLTEELEMLGKYRYKLARYLCKQTRYTQMSRLWEWLWMKQWDEAKRRADELWEHSPRYIRSSLWLKEAHEYVVRWRNANKGEYPLEGWVDVRTDRSEWSDQEF